MPPKNKKDSEQQAKRLEEEKKKKEEEEARVQLERKKYLSETLSTNLLLPASVQLLYDFPHKPVAFICEKIQHAISEAHPTIPASRLNLVLKELQYYIKDSFKLFGEIGEDTDCTKHRIFIGLMLALLLNDHQIGKKRDIDERKIKQLVTLHCHKNESFISLTKNDGLAVLNYAKSFYFSKFILLQNFNKFQKRETETKLCIYVESPNNYINDENTTFVDLSKHEEEHKVA